MGIQEIRNLKQKATQPKEKKIYTLAKISPTKRKQLATKRKGKGVSGAQATRNLYCDPLADAWFDERRTEMTGTCGCGCGQRTNKWDTEYSRFCIAHIFPKAHFPSVMYHPLNWVERAFFGGCHSSMDDAGVYRWHKMGDWSVIQERFELLTPLLSESEKSKKFYSLLEAHIRLHPCT